jgi:hypothetical protein
MHREVARKAKNHEPLTDSSRKKLFWKRSAAA